MDEILKLIEDAGDSLDDWERGYVAGLHAALDVLQRAPSTTQPADGAAVER